MSLESGNKDKTFTVDCKSLDSRDLELSIPNLELAEIETVVL